MEGANGSGDLRIEERHRKRLEEYHRARRRDDPDTLMRILDEAEGDPALAGLIDAYHEELGPPLEIGENLVYAARVLKLRAFGGLTSVAVAGAGTWLEDTAPFAGEPALGDLMGAMNLCLVVLCWALFAFGVLGAVVGSLGWLRVAFRVNRAARSGTARFVFGPVISVAGFLAAVAVVSYLVAGALLADSGLPFGPERRIEDLGAGEEGWTTPWALYVTEDGRPFLNGDYPLRSESGGTVRMWVAETAGGETVVGTVPGEGLTDAPRGAGSYVGGSFTRPVAVDRIERPPGTGREARGGEPLGDL